MSAKAWERRRAARVQRMREKKIAKIFEVGPYGPGAYTLMKQMTDEFIRAANLHVQAIMADITNYGYAIVEEESA